jgi:CTP-dependent riboflavin kinase
VLLALLKMRSQDGSIFTSSTNLAAAIGVSQQTATRYLKELEDYRVYPKTLKSAISKDGVLMERVYLGDAN